MSETVENNELGLVTDDASLTPEDSQAEAISSIMEEVPEAQPTEAAQTEEAVPAKEPGWIRQRVDKAVAKAVREAEERVSAQYEAMLAPIRQSVLERQAEDLVAQGEFRSKERALEYIQLKNGVTPTAVQAEETHTAPARNERGQFTAQPKNPTMEARAQILAGQAEKLKNNRGLDVMQRFESDPDTKQKVLSGEWDFYDVAESMQTANSGQSAKHVPSAVRNPNGTGINSVSIANMTPEQFAKLQENLSAGRKYDLRK